MKIEMLQKTVLFKGMSESEIVEAVRLLKTRERRYLKDSALFSYGQNTDSMGLVLDGRVIMKRAAQDGEARIIASAGQGEFFAEAYAYLKDAPLPFDIAALEDCRIVLFDLSALKSAQGVKGSWLYKLMANLLAVVSEKSISLSERSIFMAPKSARERILSYLESLALHRKKKEFDIPLDRNGLSTYLSLDRSALSRELSRMKDDGLIEYHKNHFKLLS